MDVVIIGAGPAGCATAIAARQANLSVVMVESAKAPRVSPGETLHPGIEPLLRRLGVLGAVQEADFQRHHGVWTERGGKRTFTPYGEDERGVWKGFQANRQVLHSIFQEAAMNAGAQLLRAARPVEAIQEASRVVGVVVERQALRARWTVDATGRSAWLAAQLGLRNDLHSPPLGVRFGWGQGEDAELKGQPCFVFRQDGWHWQAPLGNGQHAWVDLVVGEQDGTQPGGVDQTWTLRPDCAGLGYLLVGDAAATLDPSSSHGVLRALMSGMLAGDLMRRHAMGQLGGLDVGSRYRAWTCKQFNHDAEQLRRHYGWQEGLAGAL